LCSAAQCKTNFTPQEQQCALAQECKRGRPSPEKVQVRCVLCFIGLSGRQYLMRQALLKAAKALLLVSLIHQPNLATLLLFNQAFDVLAVNTSESRQVSPSYYFTDVPQIACCGMRH
jgi:hypothetical protein